MGKVDEAYVAEMLENFIRLRDQAKEAFQTYHGAVQVMDLLKARLAEPEKVESPES